MTERQGYKYKHYNNQNYTNQNPVNYSGKCDGCTDLVFTTAQVRPTDIDPAYWNQATATGQLCGRCNMGHIAIRAAGLVPAGVYTVWFLTNMGPVPAAPTGMNYAADGYDPNRLVVNSNGMLNYYVAHLNFNPFKGYPMEDGRIAVIEDVAIAFHLNRLTNGQVPGQQNVTVFYQLIAPVAYPRDESHDVDYDEEEEYDY